MSHVDIQHIQIVEFGVCLSNLQDDAWVIVPVDATVQEVIKEMVRNTAEQLRCFVQGADLPTYEPAEKYASMEALRYPIEHDDANMTPVRLFNAQNLPTEQNGLDDPSEIVFYFAICRDQQNKKLLAIRRAAQFKGVLKAKGRLIRWLDDTMMAVEDDIFKLDQDFDYIVTEDEMYILRPSGFEFTADLDERVLAKATKNTQELQYVMEFVDFNGLAEYVSTHKRAARLVAVIRSRDDLYGVTKDSLKAVCEATGVEVEEMDGKVSPVNGQEMRFLMLLDRRRYSLSLIEENPETYEAASRRKV
ncbi:MAG: Kiwa anti-phage protein KwaB-like domain-containing protein [Candidatus Methanogasteraceae archaeon]